MNVYVYDCEVFAHDWLVVIKNYATEEVKSVWNDNEVIKQWFDDEESVFIGFNSKNYDNFIIQAIRSDFCAEDVKELNDFIIAGNRGWDFQGLKYDGRVKYGADIRDDMQAGLSLKSIEGHLGKSIEETQVDFNITRALTAEEKEKTEFYCRADVDATTELVKLRLDYLRNKIQIGKLAGIKPEQALCMTNAKLTAEVLKATGDAPKDDERAYVYPTNLTQNYTLPSQAYKFFNNLADESISDEELFSTRLDLNVNGTQTTLGYGGIHGAIANYHFDHEVARKNNTRLINYDVASYYPNLMINNDYQSRAIPNKKLFSDIVERRLEAKRTGDSATASALKLVINTCYGAMLNKYNALYDPLHARSVCISGQLYLLALTCAMPLTTKIVQLNTDGIMVEVKESDYAQVTKEVQRWQEITGFVLEEDELECIYQKDVNNYIARLSNGKVKKKGAYLSTGVSQIGAFSINNNTPIVVKAVEDYFIHNIPVEATINYCNNILQFQIIAKAGHKYSKCYQIVGGHLEQVQMANRVYAAKDRTLGTLIKEKSDGSQAKIGNLPAHCLIDNANTATLEQVDKYYYIDLARKRIADFRGIDLEKGEPLWKMQ